MSYSLVGYIIMTVVLMLNVCLLTFWEQIINSLLIVLPLIFTLFIVVFIIWHTKLKKKAKTYPNVTLLYNGIVALITAFMYFSVCWLICRFSSLNFSIIHICIISVLIILLTLGGIYLYHICKYGKKQHSKRTLAVAISLGTVLAIIAGRVANLIDTKGNELMIITVVALIMGFLELFCSMLELSRYCVARKYNIVLE